MFVRAVVAFLALPGVVAFGVPLISARWFGLSPRLGAVAVVLLVLGLAGLVWCVRAFYVSGKGTLAPWSPPRHLVTHGLYRYSRNPMYCSVLLLLAGWALLFASAGLACYAAIVAVAFHVRVVVAEEPWLERTHGPEWLSYKGTVRRWLGRRDHLGGSRH